MVKAAVGATFFGRRRTHLREATRVRGRSIACYGGQMYITEIPDETFVDKNRNEIINVVVGRFPENVE
jgi:hypothetical protein